SLPIFSAAHRGWLWQDFLHGPTPSPSPPRRGLVSAISHWPAVEREGIGGTGNPGRRRSAPWPWATLFKPYLALTGQEALPVGVPQRLCPARKCGTCLPWASRVARRGCFSYLSATAGSEGYAFFPLC